jgi:hypothetical protein
MEKIFRRTLHALPLSARFAAFSFVKERIVRNYRLPDTVRGVGSLFLRNLLGGV